MVVTGDNTFVCISDVSSATFAADVLGEKNSIHDPNGFAWCRLMVYEYSSGRPTCSLHKDKKLILTSSAGQSECCVKTNKSSQTRGLGGGVWI